MTDTKYTPGPWVITQDNKGSLDDYCIGVGDYIDRVATCSKRDAHLIAAAPDLLEACIGLLQVQDGLPMTGLEATRRSVNARTAIAKAKRDPS